MKNALPECTARWTIVHDESTLIDNFEGDERCVDSGAPVVVAHWGRADLAR